MCYLDLYLACLECRVQLQPLLLDGVSALRQISRANGEYTIDLPFRYSIIDYVEGLLIVHLGNCKPCHLIYDTRPYHTEVIRPQVALRTCSHSADYDVNSISASAYSRLSIPLPLLDRATAILNAEYLTENWYLLSPALALMLGCRAFYIFLS